jgi:hypothetical protein
VNDAAVAGEHPAMRGDNDVAFGCDAVLKGHLSGSNDGHNRHCLRQTQGVCAREQSERSNPFSRAMDCFAPFAMTV